MFYQIDSYRKVIAYFKAYNILLYQYQLCLLRITLNNFMYYEYVIVLFIYLGVQIMSVKKC